jgi:hypothetical protein
MRLVVSLELLREREHRLLQQTALGADLVCRDRLELGGERGIENADVACFRAARLGGQCVASREKGDGRA